MIFNNRKFMKFFRRSIKHEYPFRFYDSDDSIFTDGCLLSFIVALLKSTRRIESGKWLKSGAETVELAATVGCEMSAKRYAYAFCHKGYFRKTCVENAPTEVLSSDFNNLMPRLSRPNVEAENQIFATGKMNRRFNFFFRRFVDDESPKELIETVF